ncbi:alpha/beta-hydrolase [Hesseltinella vesiculosa]|uniref:Alpha/beta-hydrolase n=1 Tax=Hesseltinella vesiculosa TaxID=101127 RepID=A0A1X2G5U3_9FUNG|nr:alpha/beta-hydrolase [Hesseltinella vesiculosa]
MSLPFTVLEFDPKSTAKKVDGAAIIMLQEWWGINDTIKSHAQHLSDLTGIHIAVPDLYKGKVGLTAEEASHLMNGLDWELAVKELGQLVEHLRGQGYAKIGAIGFCMGGALSLALASAATQAKAPIQAAIACYGTPPDDFKVESITPETAVQGHFAGKDKQVGFSDPAAADALEVKLAHLGNRCNIFRYPEQGHAFLNDDDWGISKRKELGFVSKEIDPKKDEQAVRDQAWQRITLLFLDTLQ